MLRKIADSGSETINLAELGITDMSELLEGMEENDKIMDKIEEEKDAVMEKFDKAREEAKAARD